MEISYRTRMHKHTDVNDPWELVAMFKDHISGYILYKADSEGIQESNDPYLSVDTLVYEHKEGSYHAAVSLCGILNACAIEESDEDKAIAAGLTKVFDARGKDAEWIFHIGSQQLENGTPSS